MENAPFEKMTLEEKAKAIYDCLIASLTKNRTLQDAELLALFESLQELSPTELREETHTARNVLAEHFGDQNDAKIHERAALVMRAGALGQDNPFLDSLKH